MGSISANRDGDNHSDIPFYGMKDCALSEGLIINCSSSCSNREIKSGKRGGGETNPARKSLSLWAASFLPFLPLARVRVRSHGCLRDIDAILHSNAGQEASASLVLKPGIGIHRGSPFLLLPFCTLARSRGPKKRRNKNNKKCFLPFRLCISHLALSSLPQSLSLLFSM